MAVCFFLYMSLQAAYPMFLSLCPLLCQSPWEHVCVVSMHL